MQRGGAASKAKARSKNKMESKRFSTNSLSVQNPLSLACSGRFYDASSNTLRKNLSSLSASEATKLKVSEEFLF